jgi:hypothetical protein
LIIGISGKAQSGKDTLCQYLRMAFAQKGIRSQRIAFADELKRVIGQDLFDLSHNQMYTSEGKTIVDPRYDLTPRYILQHAGTLLRQVYDDIWVELALRQTKNNDWVYIIPDVRFENEWGTIASQD